MGLLLDTSATTTQSPKDIINGYIVTNRGAELKAYLDSLEKDQKERLLSNSITKFGENVPLRYTLFFL